MSFSFISKDSYQKESNTVTGVEKVIKVIVADDQPIIREGIKFVIEQDKDIKVTGCAASGREALELCSRFSPDLVLMDLKMPGCDGVEGTRLIKNKYPSIKVIILTTFSEDENIAKALSNGADGYVLKDIKPEGLIMTIKSTLNGLRTVDQYVYDVVLKEFNKSDMAYEMPKNLNIILTDRELKIIRMIVFGKSNKEIASSIYLSEGRTKNIITGILKKLKIKDRVQLAIFAAKNNLI